jgi:predicted PurR-regulated permease PerM
MQKIQLEISFQTMLKVVFFAASIYLVTKSLGILFVIYISIIVASALRPVVNYAKYLRIPKPIAILIIYLAIIALIAFIISMIFPPIINEMTAFIRNLPTLVGALADRYSWIKRYIDEYQLQDYFKSLSSTALSWISNTSSGFITNAWTITSGFFGLLIGAFLVFTLSFYLLVGEKNLQKSLLNFFPGIPKKSILTLMSTLQTKLGSWLRGQLSLMFIVGLLDYIGFAIIRTPYALPLAVIAGLLEVVPYIGPNIAAVIGFLVVAPSSLIGAIGVLIVSFVVQQLENNVIVPMVMKQAVGLDPIIIIVSLSVGAKIFGILGALLSVPFVVTIQIILQFYRVYEKEHEVQQLEQHDDQPITAADRITMGDWLRKFSIRRKL